MHDKLDQLNAMYRSDLYWFITRSFKYLHPGADYKENWHIKFMADLLMALESGDTKRLMIQIAPRQLKSFCANIALPAWVLGRDPTKKLICVSYSDDLATDFSRKTKEIMETSWYKDMFPNTHINRKRKASAGEFHTSKGGMRLAASTGGTLTGRGGDYIIIDDPLKAQDASSEAARTRCINFYHDTLYSRLDDKNEGRICLVMQRLHTDDLAGHLMQQNGWQVECLPAIATQKEERFIRGKCHVRQAGEALHPERESVESLEIIKQSMQERHFEAQYQQNPLPPGGNLIKREWLHYYDSPPEQKDIRCIVQSWDTASETSERNDYSVCTTWAITDEAAYLLHVLRDRYDFPTLKQKVWQMKCKYNATYVLVEKASSGTQILQSYGRGGRAWLKAAIPKEEKAIRIEGCSDALESGQLLFPREAPWLDTFTNELLAFPNGRFDDQADSMAHFVKFYTPRRNRWIQMSPSGRPNPVRPQSVVRRRSMRDVW